MKILIIDDAPEIRLVARVALRRAGLVLAEAGDGADGLTKAQSERPDAILLDLHLPDMDGLAVLKALKADAATARIPVVVLSATLPELARLGGLGAHAAVSKPFDVNGFAAELLDKLAWPPLSARFVAPDRAR